MNLFVCECMFATPVVVCRRLYMYPFAPVFIQQVVIMAHSAAPDDSHNISLHTAITTN